MYQKNKNNISIFFNIPLMLKKLLIVFLILLPFQQIPKLFYESIVPNSNLLLKSISYADEISFFFILALLLSFIALKPNKYKLEILAMPISKPVFLFLFISFISIMLNNVPIIQGTFGIYDVLKNIIIIFLFASLKWNKEELFSLIQWIKLTIVILALVGIIGEILAILGLEQGYLTTIKWEVTKRFGLYRVQSLTGKGNINYLGMYTLLGFFLFYITPQKRFRSYIGLIFSFCLIILTFSRQTWLGLALMLVLIKRKLILPSLFIIMAIIFMSVSSLDHYDPEGYYRAFTYLESAKLFIENPLIGVGPGMFGGLASVLFDSPYYIEWPDYFEDMIYRLGSLDAYWPLILVETGLIGFLFFFIIWISLYKEINIISESFRSDNDLFYYKLGMILKNYIIALIIMCFFTGLNKPFVIYTFFAICGIYLSLYYQKNHLKSFFKICL
ncbi:MAG: O-antigen ligase family protein [Candidatus Hodarchaeota archaeon]